MQLELKNIKGWNQMENNWMTKKLNKSLEEGKSGNVHMMKELADLFHFLLMKCLINRPALPTHI